MRTTHDARPPRIAVVDRDAGFLGVLVDRLHSVGWRHDVLADPPPVDQLVGMRLNALLIDLELLGPQGWTYLETLCARFPGLGVVVCTRHSSVAQRVRGLRLGADDWVTKSRHPEELLARVEAVIRGRVATPGRADQARRAGEVDLRPDQFQAFVDGVSVELTPREFQLVSVLADAQGRVIDRDEIYQRVWGYAMARGDRSVDVFVRKLRRKLTRASPGCHYIHTHFGIGYRFEPQDVRTAPADQSPGPGGGDLSPPALTASEAA